MICLDIYLEQCWQNLYSEEDHKFLASHVFHPLMAWDVMSQTGFHDPKAKTILKFRELAKLRGWILDTSMFRRKDFDALVVTDLNQVIEWVSEGFERMTGYSASEVIGRKPKLLQGPNTSLSTKIRIREALVEKRPVEATLLNYKKDGSAYRCRIEVVPLFAASRSPTHFLAFEKSVG